jgi:hypothetical protein
MRSGAQHGPRMPARLPRTGTATRLTAALLALMVVQPALGLWWPDGYRDVAWIRATWYGNDWVTLLVAAPMLAAGLVRAQRGSGRALLVWLGGIGYCIYNYAFYLFGASLNAFFLLYVTGVTLGLAALAATVAQTERSGFLRCAGSRPGHARAGMYLMAVAALLAAVWIAVWALYVFAGRATPVEPDAFRLVAALDLTLMVPALAGGGFLLWRRRPFGIAVASIASVQAALYLLVLMVSSAVAISRGLAEAPGEIIIWGPLCVATAAVAAWLIQQSERILAAGDDSDHARPVGTAMTDRV